MHPLAQPLVTPQEIVKIESVHL